jgi:predicted aspartyl protease
MGHAIAKIKIIGKKGEIEKDVLIDTGSTYTLINGDDLKKVGVEPIDEIIFTTIEGRKIKRKIGRAEVEVMGRREFTIVVFAEDENKEVLGVHALEGLRPEVDVITDKLKEVEAVLAI